MNPVVETSRIASLKQSIARHPVPSFLLMLYPISWILFLPALLGTAGFGVIPFAVPAQVSILLATMFGLTAVAFLVTRIADGREGTRALRGHYYRFRTNPLWYFFAVLAAPILLLAAGLVVHGTGVFSPVARNAAQIPATYLFNLVLIAVLISVFEEGAWMGFMTARLQRRFGALLASVMVAPCFGFIHFPLFFITDGLISNSRPQGVHVVEYAFYLLLLFSVPVRIVVTWVFNSTGGSLPIVALLHASVD